MGGQTRQATFSPPRWIQRPERRERGELQQEQLREEVAADATKRRGAAGGHGRGSGAARGRLRWRGVVGGPRRWRGAAGGRRRWRGAPVPVEGEKEVMPREWSMEGS